MFFSVLFRRLLAVFPPTKTKTRSLPPTLAQLAENQPPKILSFSWGVCKLWLLVIIFTYLFTRSYFFILFCIYSKAIRASASHQPSTNWHFPHLECGDSSPLLAVGLPPHSKNTRRWTRSTQNSRVGSAKAVHLALFVLSTALYLAGPLPTIRAEITYTTTPGSVNPSSPNTWSSSILGYIGYTTEGNHRL
jgi:hypothetical protein